MPHLILESVYQQAKKVFLLLRTIEGYPSLEAVKQKWYQSNLFSLTEANTLGALMLQQYPKVGRKQYAIFLVAIALVLNINHTTKLPMAQFQYHLLPSTYGSPRSQMVFCPKAKLDYAVEVFCYVFFAFYI